MVTITSLEDFLQAFFKKEKKTLSENYPGLTLHRLRNDLSLYTEHLGVAAKEMFDQAYIPYITNPITVFFSKLKEGIPLEYITGHSYFYRSLFRVSPDVLIPRSETEILVELAAQEIQKNYKDKKCSVADVGTGSGAIALSLMLDSHAALEVFAIDISEEALLIAKENYFNMAYSFSSKHKIQFVKGDRLKNIDETFDLILSNPPYIKKKADQETVHFQVNHFEPQLALYLDDELYEEWFNDFFSSIHEKLSNDGISIIEGHENHLESLGQMAERLAFSKVEIIKDYTGRNRFLRLKK